MGRRLVRDRALQNWVVPGAEHQVRPVIDLYEHQELLRAKLLEECGEVILAGDRRELRKELADVLSVLCALASINEVEWPLVLNLQQVRDVTQGGFTEGLVWETPR